jgi:hypothetical protein
MIEPPYPALRLRPRGQAGRAQSPVRRIRLTKRESINLLFSGRGKKGLDSSDGKKNHGNQPAEKDDIYEESFHSIFYRHICD